MRVMEITSRRVLNEVNHEEVTLYVEWHEENFTIMLWNISCKLFEGQMAAEDMKYFSEELSKSQKEYLQETKDAFKRESTEIQFYIRDDLFEWKRNNIWTLGRIPLSPILDGTVVFKTFQSVLSSYEVIQRKVSLLTAENESLRSVNVKLTSDIEDMIKLKERMEADLYKRFILVLNGKKERIRMLRKMLKQEDKRDPVFDASTDEDSSVEADSKEEAEDEEKIEDKRAKPEKRRLDNEKNSRNVKHSKPNFINEAVKNEEEANPVASTSKDRVNDSKNDPKNDEKTDGEGKEQKSCKKKVFHSRISFIMEEDSEEDLFS